MGDLDSLLAWWKAAGVHSAEAEAILAAPTPVAAKPAPSAEAASRAPAPPKPAKPLKPAGPAPGIAAREAAAKAATLEALETAIRAFDGCALKREATQAVVFDGRRDAQILVIGEAPDRDEDAAGVPFVGKSGQLLDKMMAAIGLSRQTNLLITNCVYWRPAGNRAPTPAEIAQCLPFVERTIELAQPRAVLLMGAMPAQALLKTTDSPLRLHGKSFMIENSALTKPVKAMVMLHPAYLLRRPQDKRLAWADLLALESWLDQLGLGRGAST